MFIKYFSYSKYLYNGSPLGQNREVFFISEPINLILRLSIIFLISNFSHKMFKFDFKAK